MPRKKMKLTADELGRELLLYIVGLVRKGRNKDYELRYTLEELEQILRKYIVTVGELKVYSRYADVFNELYETGVYFDEMKDRARANLYFIEIRIAVAHSLMHSTKQFIEFWRNDSKAIPEAVLKKQFEAIEEALKGGITDYLLTKRIMLVTTLYRISLIEPLIKASADAYNMPELNELFSGVVGGFVETTMEQYNELVTEFDKIYLDEFMDHPLAPAIDPQYKIWLEPIKKKEVFGSEKLNEFLYNTLLEQYKTGKKLEPKYLRRLMDRAAKGDFREYE